MDVRRFSPSFPISASRARPILLLIVALWLGAAAMHSQTAQAKARLAEGFGKIPLSFEEARGQTGPGAQFVAHGPGYAVALSPDRATLEVYRPQNGTAAPPTVSTLVMKLAGSNGEAKPAAEEQLPGKANYFIGNDRSQWQTGLPTYARVAYHGVYPGVDLLYYGNQRELEYDFVVAPGADPPPSRSS